jgi:general secretion pathway protein G
MIITRRKGLRSEAGFTLLELLIVIAILGMLAVVGTVQMMSYLERARTDTAMLEIDQLGAALNLYRIDVGRLPTSDEGLKALLEAPPSVEHWRGPYLTKPEAIRDPWGRMFVYRQPGSHGPYDLMSYGADGSSSVTGDNFEIVNWQKAQ